MAWWNGWLGREAKSSGSGPVVAQLVRNQPVWTARDYKQLADEAYVRNAAAYRCVKMIASGVAGIPWLLYSGTKEKQEDHPLLKLLANPAPMIGGQQMFEAVAAYLLLAGNSYIEGVGPTDYAPPTELWPQRPDRMKVVAGDYGMPRAFEYEAAGLKKTWEVDPINGRGPILHIKEFHPTDDWYGLPRVDPAAYGVDRHNSASAHNKALIDNGGRPSGVLVFEPVVQPGGNKTSAPENVIKAAEKRLVETHGGPANAGKPFVTSGTVKWEEMGLSPKDMDFNEGKADAARDICNAFGVPHLLVVPGSSTYNNLKEARLQLYEDTILPLASQLRQALNGWLVPRFSGVKLRLEHDLDGIPALEPRREATRKGTVELFKARIITRNEARDALQYDEIEGDDGDAFDKPAIVAPGDTANPEDKPAPADGDA
jgi:HK97 family phage portal protein